MATVTNARAYGIGAVSRATGVNIETIRYYERIALMPKPERTRGGNRQYDHDQLQRLSFIKRSRELGFSIDEIRGLLEMVERDGVSCREVRAVTLEHLRSVREKIRRLRKLEKVLGTMASQCSGGDLPDCPIIAALYEA